MTRPDTPFLMRAALLIAVVGLGLLVSFRFFPPDERDPRRAYRGPFRNVHPDIAYVPDSQCADCHAAIAATYARHPMGRSLLPVAEAPMPPTDAAHNLPFAALGSRFSVEPTRHRRAAVDAAGRTVAEQTWPIHHVIGSGTRGSSYLTERDGFVFQTPISWFGQRQKWDLSPGFGPHLPERAVVAECLFCHANRAEPRPGTLNGYGTPVFTGHAIGCQRCHGPGSLHVAERSRDGGMADTPDTSIVNPHHLERPLRDAVCEQCHLVGEARHLRRDRALYDFRPGLPLDAFWAIFVRTEASEKTPKAVGHVEQMRESRCSQATQGTMALGCVSCHDPHRRVEPEERIGHYRDRCLTCHVAKGCAVAEAEWKRLRPDDSCIDCHMPRYGAGDIPHTAATDHRIPRRAAPPARAVGREPLPFASFHPGRKEDERDLGIALTALAAEGKVPVAPAVARALPLLDAAVRRRATDSAAATARGRALVLAGRTTDALAAFEAVLTTAPDDELALIGAAASAEALGRTDAALASWSRATVVSPFVADYHRRLTLLHVKTRAWDKAREACAAWLRFDGLNAEALAIHSACLTAAGERAAAAEEFRRVEALSPANLAELRARYAPK